MMAQTTWKWVAVAAVCASALGAGAVLALGPGGRLAPQDLSPAPVPVAAQNPEPPAKDKGTDEEWLPKLGGNKRADPGKKRPAQDPINYLLGPTAFPELTPPKRDENDPKDEKYKEQFEKLCPRVFGKIELSIDPTDDTLRKLLKVRLNEGVWESRRFLERMRIGAWSSDNRSEFYECLADMQAAATELWDGRPKELIPWLEELVIVSKEAEKFHRLRVEIGTDPPQALDTARRHRFRLEAALWKAKKKP